MSSRFKHPLSWNQMLKWIWKHRSASYWCERFPVQNWAKSVQHFVRDRRSYQRCQISNERHFETGNGKELKITEPHSVNMNDFHFKAEQNRFSGSSGIVSGRSASSVCLLKKVRIHVGGNNIRSNISCWDKMDEELCPVHVPQSHSTEVDGSGRNLPEQYVSQGEGYPIAFKFLGVSIESLRYSFDKAASIHLISLHQSPEGWHTRRLSNEV